MPETYVVTVLKDSKLLPMLVDGLFTGEVLAIHKVDDDEARWLRPDVQVHPHD